MTMGVQLSFADALFADEDVTKTALRFANDEGVSEESTRREQLVADWRNWLVKVRKVDEDALALFDKLLGKFELDKAFERSKCLDVLAGARSIDGWALADADVLGLFDSGLDYHTCWDRAHAARVGCPKSLVGRIYENTCWRIGHYAFADRSGQIVWSQEDK